jgi:hypothetical protein
MDSRERKIYTLLMRNLLETHPLPWITDKAFERFDVYTSSGVMVIKCQSLDEAELLIETANSFEKGGA